MNTFTVITVIIGIILAAVAVSYNKKTFKKDYVDKPNEEKLHLLAQFKATQTLSKQVHTDLYNYVNKHNAFDQFMWPGITYGAYLTQMEQSQRENLSDELYKNLEGMEIPSMTILSMCQSLDNQFTNLTLIHQEVKIKSKNL
jgi:hypothetical protein